MKKNIFIPIFVAIIFNVGFSQVKIEGQLNYGRLISESANGYEIEVKLTKKIHKQHWGVSVQNYLSEDEGKFIDNGNRRYFHDYTGRALEYEYAGIPYTGLKVLKTKADKFTMSGVNIFRQFRLTKKNNNQFNINFGLGIYLVNIIHVDYVIFPDEFYSDEFGEYIGPEFDLPIFRFQKYLDPGLDLNVTFDRHLSQRFGINLNTGLKWLPVSKNIILNMGVGVFLYNKALKNKI